MEGSAVTILDILPPGREECQRMILLMPWLHPTRSEVVVVEQLRGVLHDRLVAAVVLAQQDLAAEILWVQVVQALQQGGVQVALLRKLRIPLRAQL